MKRSKTAGLVFVILSLVYLYLSLFHGVGKSAPWLLWLTGMLGGAGLFFLKK